MRRDVILRVLRISVFSVIYLVIFCQPFVQLLARTEEGMWYLEMFMQNPFWGLLVAVVEIGRSPVLAFTFSQMGLFALLLGFVTDWAVIWLMEKMRGKTWTNSEDRVRKEKTMVFWLGLILFCLASISLFEHVWMITVVTYPDNRLEFTKGIVPSVAGSIIFIIIGITMMRSRHSAVPEYSQ